MTGQPTLGHPDIISPCPLLPPNRTKPDLPILEESERAYLESLTIQELEKIKRILLDLSTQIITSGPEKQEKIKITSQHVDLIRPLVRLLEKMTLPLQESGKYYQTCAAFITQLATVVQRIQTRKRTEQALAQAEKPEGQIIAEAKAAFREASTKLRPLPDLSETLSVNRYGLACVLLVMKIYDSSEVSRKGILNPGISLPTNSGPFNFAIQKMAELLGMRPLHLKIALGITAIRPSVNQQYRDQAATAILALLSKA
jgi:hypothetical protein